MLQDLSPGLHTFLILRPFGVPGLPNSIARKRKSLQARIVSGSVVLLSGTGLTMAINLVYNIAVARYLGAKGFGHATVVYTLLTLLSAVTLAYQMIGSKVVAQQDTPNGKTAVYRMLHRGSLIFGIVVGLLLLALQKPISGYLNLPDSNLIALIAIGAAFYIPLGARRGLIQGTLGFRALALNMVIEQAVRLAGSLALIMASMGVHGVIIANSAAIVVAYFAVPIKLTGHDRSPLSYRDAVRETFHATVFFSGQMLINNCGIVLVNHFFLAGDAGIYAAVAMVGRVISSMSMAVVNSTFPIVAGTLDEERRDLRVIATSLMLVLGIGVGIAAALMVVPASLWSHLFGAEFQIAGRYNIPYLLALYALSTVIYSLAALIISFEMSYKIANTSWVQLAFSGVLVAGICRFHSSLREVVLVQLVLMIVLFALVSLPFLITALTDPKDMLRGMGCAPFRLIRRVAEEEVIAEFLKSDFHRHEFREYRESLSDMVLNPDLDNAEDNAKRRALLFIRHLSLWKELPEETEWHQVEVNDGDLDNIRIFPRAQWRKTAHGNFSATGVAAGIRTRPHVLEASFLAKIDAISDRLQQADPRMGAVILIGVNESEPLTVLDGNHRLIAAMLSSPNRVKKLRFLCGLSPRMTECCWYNSNLMTLFRYARNVLTNTVRSPEAELARLLRNTG
jgi:O-antigen/teichoic acid export membrane protein